MANPLKVVPGCLRFRYSLRTLFIAVTLVSAWFAYQVNWLHDRQRIRNSLLISVDRGHVFDVMQNPCGQGNVIVIAPGILPWLGEHGVAMMILSFYDDPADPPVDHAIEIERVRRLFPRSQGQSQYDS